MCPYKGLGYNNQLLICTGMSSPMPSTVYLSDGSLVPPFKYRGQPHASRRRAAFPRNWASGLKWGSYAASDRPVRS